VKRISRTSGVAASSARSALIAGIAAHTMPTRPTNKQTTAIASKTANSPVIIVTILHRCPVEGLVENLWNG